MAPYNPHSQFIPPPPLPTATTPTTPTTPTAINNDDPTIISQQANMQNQMLQSTMGYQQVQMQQLHQSTTRTSQQEQTQHKTPQSALTVNQASVLYPHVENMEVPDQDSLEEEDAPAKKKRNMSGPSPPRPSVPARLQKNVTRDEP